MTTSQRLLEARNLDLETLVATLRAQEAARLDVVAPVRELVAVGGKIEVIGAAEPTMSLEGGVSDGRVSLLPNEIGDGGIAEKLKIPVHYLRKLRQGGHDECWDSNVNTMLRAMDRRTRFLVRGVLDPAGNTGVMRALLSDKYRIVNNLDVLMAVLAGIKMAGADVDIASADLTPSRMHVKVRSNDVAVLAPALLANYTSPFNGKRGVDNPVVFAGFLVENSEVGKSKFKITPQITVEVCGNGMTLTQDAIEEVHLGGRLDAGVIAWRTDTHAAALELVTKKARDAVASFLDRAFVEQRLREIEHEAGEPVRRVVPTIEHVSSTLKFSTAVQATILDHFIRGRDHTSGGVLHAVTSAAKTVENADEAYEIERQGLSAMRLARAFAR